MSSESHSDEESSPFLPNEKPLKPDPSPPSAPLPPPPSCEPSPPIHPGWTADGVPFNMVGQPLARTPWTTGVSDCLGLHDDFCSSDLEVCMMGCLAPCVLYGSNVERLGSAPRAFTSHCMAYTALCLIGNSFFGWNCLAPWLSYNGRTALRRSFNLQGTFESVTQSYGCGESLVANDIQREQCETACDFATHVFCHPCALCQEGREIRRRIPHPAFNIQTALVMYPPTEQTMVRGMP